MRSDTGRSTLKASSPREEYREPALPRHRAVLAAARRVLWTHLRVHGRGPRAALRERLRAFLGAVGHVRLLRLLREASFAAAAAAALLGATTAAEAIELADVVAGQGGFAVEGKGRLPSPIGSSVADAGDVNGDGIPDAIVGSQYSLSYVVFGRADGAPIELEEVAAGHGGFVIRGESEGDSSGSSVSGAGDVNGDGLSDLLIGAPWADPGGRQNAGASYVVFGKATTEPVELSEVAAGRGGFVIRGENEGDRSGRSVSGAGDFNGDGLSDLLIGAPEADPGGRNRAGASYLVLGKATTEPIELSVVAAGRGGFVIQRTTRQHAFPLSRRSSLFGPWPRKESRTLDGKIGYLRIAQMESGEEFLDGLGEWMSRFKDTRGLIIDVRGNGGGSREALRRLFPYFTEPSEEPYVANAAVYRLGPGEERGLPQGYLEDRFLHPLSSPRWSRAERAAIEKFAKSFQPEWKFDRDEFSEWHYLVLSPSREQGVYHYRRPVAILMAFSPSRARKSACRG